MHFSKTYAQLLLSLPPELRENAIQYRQLKKLINQVVIELTSLVLNPSVLHELLEQVGDEDAVTGSPHMHQPKLVYEVTDSLGHLEPHLRLLVDPAARSASRSSSLPVDEDSSEAATETSPGVEEDDGALVDASNKQISLLWLLQRQALHPNDETESPFAHITQSLDDLSISDTHSSGHSDAHSTSSDDSNPAGHVEEHTHFDENANEVVIPLASDQIFFQTLSTAIARLSAHLETVQSNFVVALDSLSRTISDSARPTSSTTSNFHPHSGISSRPWSISNTTKVKSDLYAWREIFQLYIEAEVFESVHELDRGERSVEESENRLKLFAERVTSRGLGDNRKLKSKASRDALETFLELNMSILNIKKFQFANAEATRKILKKHSKRTSLPILPNELSYKDMVMPKSTGKLPRVLVQAIGETLLPIIPHLDDYTCLVCTSIAFKPIRLSCGHLFCVRCLVKMQKRGTGNCPMCRAACVLKANRTNVDWALLNFMQDWFPIESQEKMLENQQEAAREQQEEFGLDPDQPCTIM
ncbi:hypothetical protein H0H92_011154 [Tricholoma furcatifolium]|nr:hypothetical protein H0H92_011154 [Tricholoma furcatifolium]